MSFAARSCLLVGAFSLLLLPKTPAEEPEERLLLGFEPAEIDKLMPVFKGKKTENKTPQGKKHWTVAHEEPWPGQWLLHEGNASQGKYALRIGIARKPDPKLHDYTRRIQYDLPLPAEALDYYG